MVYETKNMMGLFWVKSKMKLGMFKLWKNLDSIGYVKVSVDPLTLPKSVPAGAKHVCFNTTCGENFIKIGLYLGG